MWPFNQWMIIVLNLPLSTDSSISLQNRSFLSKIAVANWLRSRNPTHLFQPRNTVGTPRWIWTCSLFFLFFFVGAKLIINISVADISCLTSLENSSACVEPLSFEERWEQVLERRRWMGRKKEKRKEGEKNIHSAWEPRGLVLRGGIHIDWWDERRRTFAFKRESQISLAVFYILVCIQCVAADITY